MPVGVGGRDVRAPRARGDRLRRRGPATPSWPPGSTRCRSRRAVDDRRPGGGDRPACAAAIETPLGPVLDGLRLRDFARADRLDELGFELPLAGGDEPHGRGRRCRGSPACSASSCAADDPLAGYADRLGDPALRQSVRGYLTGSLDLVVRLPTRRPRFAVLDYKTNWLGELDEPLTVVALPPGGARRRDAAPPLRAAGAAVPGRAAPVPALAAAGLRPRASIWPGVVYLFLRGMTGADMPVLDGAPCGVFGWQPPAGLVRGAQ